MAVTNVKKSKHWLDPSSPKAKRLLKQIDPQTMETKSLQRYRNLTNALLQRKSRPSP